MSRLAATIGCDVRLQWRNGFYYASGLLVVTLIFLVIWLPAQLVELFLPIVIFQNVMTNSFYFVAGLILLENGEGTRAAQTITPLRRDEYLGAKVLTLGALSLVESLLIAAAARGLGWPLLTIGLGIVLASVVFTLFGAGLVAAYRSLNEFVMPSVLYTFVLALPMLGYFGIGAPILYAWHPADGPLLMMAASGELPGWRVGLAIAVPVLWIAPVWLWSRRALQRNARA